MGILDTAYNNRSYDILLSQLVGSTSINNLTRLATGMQNFDISIPYT